MRPPKIVFPHTSWKWEDWFERGFIVIPVESATKKACRVWNPLKEKYLQFLGSPNKEDRKKILSELREELEKTWHKETVRKSLYRTRKSFLDELEKDEKVRKKYQYRLDNLGKLSIALLTGVHLHSKYSPVVIDIDDIEKGDEELSRLGLSLQDLVSSTWSVKTPRGGYHVYFLLPDSKIRQIPNKVKVFDKIDVRSFGGYVLIPPSPGYDVISNAPLATMPDRLFKAIASSSKEPEKKRIRRDQKGNQVDVKKVAQEIVEVLQGYYVRGYRHEITKFIAGGLWWYKFSQEEAYEIISHICDHFGDEERKGRLINVRTTYAHTVDDPPAGLGPNGLGGLFPELAAKIRTILRKTRGPRYEEEIRLPNGKWLSIREEFDEDTGNSYPATFLEWWNGKNELKSILVGYFAPLKVIRKVDPVGEKLACFLQEKLRRPIQLSHVEATYFFRFLTPNGPVDVFGGDQLSISERLSAQNVVVEPRYVRESIAHVYTLFRAKGRVQDEHVKGILGIFKFDDGWMLSLPWSDARRPEDLSFSGEALRKDLEEICKIHDQFYTDRSEVFATTLKYLSLAPFSFVFRQKGGFFPHLCLYDAADAGKSSLLELLSLIMFGVFERKGEGEVSTPYRFGEILGGSTFPVEIAEGRILLENTHLVDMLKASVESLVARSRGWNHTTVQTVTPALRPILLTVNASNLRSLTKEGADADAIERRFVLVRFSSKKAKISLAQRRKFDEYLRSIREDAHNRFHALRAFIVKYIISRYASIFIQADYGRSLNAFATELWRDLFQEVGLEPPTWIDLFVTQETPETRDERRREDVRFKFESYFSSRIRELPQREHPLSLREGIEILLRNDRVPGLRIAKNLRAGGQEEVVLRKEVVTSVLENVCDFESLERILPNARRVRRLFGKVKVSCLAIPFSDFLDFVTPAIAESQEDLELQKIFRETVEGVEFLISGHLAKTAGYSESDIEEYLSMHFDEYRDRISSLDPNQIRLLHKMVYDDRVSKTFVSSYRLPHELLEILFQSAADGSSLEDLLKKLQSQGKDDPSDPSPGGGWKGSKFSSYNDPEILRSVFEILAQKGHEWARKALRWLNKGGRGPLCGLCSRLSDENGVKWCDLAKMQVQEFQRACHQFRMRKDLLEEINSQIPF